MSDCSSSGVAIIRRSAQPAASATVITLKPSASAFLAVAEPERSATTTSFAPLSFRFSAWARPWLP